MRFCSITSQDRKATIKNWLALLTLLLFASISYSTSAETAEEVMRNIVEVYEDIDDYKAVAHTYEVDSMDVSESVFETQQPIVAFNLFFRKQDGHAVKEIGKSRHGVFRIELLSALGRLKTFDPQLLDRERRFGQNCYVLEVSSPNTQGETVTLWISPENWTVLELILAIGSDELVITQFKYAATDRRKRFLPTETRSFFALTKKVFINRISDYQINTGLPSEIFEKRGKNGG